MRSRSKKRSHMNRTRVSLEASDNKLEDSIESIYQHEPANLQYENLTD